MEEKSVAVIVGRGRPSGVHLSPLDWGSFVGRVIEHLVIFGTFFRNVYAVGYGSGGVEENCTVFGNVPDHQMNGFRTKLAELSALYGQDAILLLVGELEIIEPRPRQDEL
jgi:hypothetical protein